MALELIVRFSRRQVLYARGAGRARVRVQTAATAGAGEVPQDERPRRDAGVASAGTDQMLDKELIF